MGAVLDQVVAVILRRGVVIPASPLATTRTGRLDEPRNRVLCVFYWAVGHGGLPFESHPTWFPTRHPKTGLSDPF